MTESTVNNRNAWMYINTSNPMVAWNAYRGVLLSPSEIDEKVVPLSVWYAGLLRQLTSTRTKNEIMLEGLRRQFYPEKVSRFEGLYTFPSREDAVRAKESLSRANNHFNELFLAEVDVQVKRSSLHDMDWITHNLNKEQIDVGWMHEYWSGRPMTSEPSYEQLIEGQAVILGTDVRDLAYSILATYRPKSLALLEVSRMAAYLGYASVGSITARASYVDDKTLKVDHLMFFPPDVVNGPLVEGIQKLKEENPDMIRWSDFHLKEGLVTPDLTDQSFPVDLSDRPILKMFYNI